MHMENPIIHYKDFYVRFTGNFYELKNNGFEFQKLFAGNHMQWQKDNLRIWKKGAEVTHDTYGVRFPLILNTLLNMGIDDLPFEPSLHFTDISYLVLFVNNETFECTTDKSEFKKAEKKENDFLGREDYKDTDDITGFISPWSRFALTPKSIEDIKNLVDKGWIEVAKCSDSTKVS